MKNKLRFSAAVLLLLPSAWLHAQAETSSAAPAADARAEAMSDDDTRARAMRESEARARAMQESEARSRAMQEGDARARAMGADEAAPRDRSATRDANAEAQAEAERARRAGRAVTDLPPGVTDGGGSSVTGGATRRASSTEGAVIGDGLRLNDGGMNLDDQAPDRRDPEVTARMIAETDFLMRDRAMTLAERELHSGTTLNSALERASADLSGQARLRMNEAMKKLGAARTEFAKAISRGRSANENRWEGARSEVVERHRDYVSAQREALRVADEVGATVQEPGRLPAPPVLR